MTIKAGLADALQRLSPRERMLGSVALALVLVIGLAYGALAPGIAAARSATDRSATASHDLNVARTLAASLSSRASAVNVDALRQSAEAAGLVVIATGAENGATTVRVSGTGPVSILTWIARTTDLGAMHSAAIEPAATGGATATILFAGPAR